MPPRCHRWSRRIPPRGARARAPQRCGDAAAAIRANLAQLELSDRARVVATDVRRALGELGRSHESFDLVFVDGDHSLDGITADWAHWTERLARGGIVALHDTLLTPNKPPGYTLGSIEYFRDHIRHDPHFEIIKQRDSLSVLRKR